MKFSETAWPKKQIDYVLFSSVVSLIFLLPTLSFSTPRAHPKKRMYLLKIENEKTPLEIKINDQPLIRFKDFLETPSHMIPADYSLVNGKNEITITAKNPSTQKEHQLIQVIEASTNQLIVEIKPGEWTTKKFDLKLNHKPWLWQTTEAVKDLGKAIGEIEKQTKELHTALKNAHGNPDLIRKTLPFFEALTKDLTQIPETSDFKTALPELLKQISTAIKPLPDRLNYQLVAHGHLIEVLTPEGESPIRSGDENDSLSMDIRFGKLNGQWQIF